MIRSPIIRFKNMCGIFGYMGGRNAVDSVLEGLKRMDYRGYDSWGVAYPEDNKLIVRKQIGSLDDSAMFSVDSAPQIAIGHKRWATHGGVTNTNAHPHFSTDFNSCSINRTITSVSV